MTDHEFNMDYTNLQLQKYDSLCCILLVQSSCQMEGLDMGQIYPFTPEPPATAPMDTYLLHHLRHHLFDWS